MLSNPTAYCATRFERALACLEDLGVNLVAQGGDEAVNAAADLFDDQALRRRVGPGIDLDLVAALAQAIEGCIADVAVAKTRNLFCGM